MSVIKFLKPPKSIFAEKYRLKKIVDSGGLAEVWEATSTTGHIKGVFAVKVFPQLQPVGIQSLKRAYKLVRHFKHGNILPATKLDVYKNQPYLEMRFCNNGSVASKICLLNESDITKCFYQIASALAYLHAESIVHKNIKPANILINNDDYYCYYADLSFNTNLRQIVEQFADISLDDMSKLNFLSANKARTSPACYFAPELFKSGFQASAASDVWALGATMFHVATGKLPFGFRGGEAQANGKAMNSLSNIFSENLNQLITRCLSEKEEDRPTAQEIAFFLKNDTANENVLQREQVLNDNYVRSLMITDKIKTQKFDGIKPRKVLPKILAICLLVVSISGLVVYYFKQSSNISEYVIKEVPTPSKADTVTQFVVPIKVVSLTSIPVKFIPVKKRKPILVIKSPIESSLDRHFDSIKRKVEKALLNEPSFVNQAKTQL